MTTNPTLIVRLVKRDRTVIIARKTPVQIVQRFATLNLTQGESVGLTLVAGELIQANRAVLTSITDGKSYKCDGGNGEHTGRAVGISRNSSAAGGSLAVAKPGTVMSDPVWNWMDGAIYAGLDGVLTQDVSSLVQYSPIAMSLSKTKLIVQLGFSTHAL